MNISAFLKQSEAPENSLYLVDGLVKTENVSPNLLDYDNTSGEVNIFNDVSALIIIEQSCGEINYTINLAENAKLTLVFIGLKACKINFSINQASTSDVTVFQLLLDANAVVTGVTVNLDAPAAIFKING